MATVGSVYAKAVFELAGESRGDVGTVSTQLHGFWVATQEHSALVAALTGPAVDVKHRKAILADVSKSLGLTGLASRLLELLAERGRLAQLPEILHDLDSLIEASQGVQVGRVRSAVELSAEEIAALSAALTKRMGGRVKLTQEVDPSLLGGVVATVSGRTFDASLRTQIERFKNELI
jgi:F-type H+-transporting ATPase subunit delta